MPYWLRSFDLMASRNGFMIIGKKLWKQKSEVGFVWQSHGPTAHSPIALAREHMKQGQHQHA